MLSTHITYHISVNTAINVILLTNKNDITLRDWNFFLQNIRRVRTRTHQIFGRGNYLETIQFLKIFVLDSIV